MRTLSISFILATLLTLPAPGIAQSAKGTSRERTVTPDIEIAYDKFKDVTTISTSMMLGDDHHQLIQLSIRAQHQGQARTSPDTLYLSIGCSGCQDGPDDKAQLILLVDGIRSQTAPVSRSRSGTILTTILPTTVDQLVQISAAKSAEGQLSSLEFVLTEMHRSLFGKVAYYFRNGERGGHLDVPEFKIEYDAQIGYTRVTANFANRNESGHLLLLRLGGNHNGRTLRTPFDLELHALTETKLLMKDDITFTVDGHLIKVDPNHPNNAGLSITMDGLESLRQIAVGKNIVCHVDTGDFTLTRAQQVVIIDFVGYFLGVK